MPDPTRRVVSLIASATETIAALGCADWLVGRSHECDYPPSVARLPICSAPRIDVRGTSREIDDRVKGALRNAVSIYELDSAMIERLRPSHIVTQSQCAVCAVSLDDVTQAVCNWFGSRPEIVSVEPNALRDVWASIGQIAAALGVDDRGRTLVESLEQRLQDLAARNQELSGWPTVACLEWLDPLMAAGNWVPELVVVAGGRDLFGRAGRHSSWMTWDELRAGDPDVIVTMPCGWDIAKTREEMTALEILPGWDELRAVKNGRVYITDGNQYFNRPGPRLVESAEILAEILHPGQFDFGHQGTGWSRHPA